MVAERAQGARSSSGRRSRLCRDPPEITAALIGERVDVLYRLSYDVIEPGGRKAEQTGRFWCPGEITAISSSSWRSNDGKCKGEGFIFVRFDDGRRRGGLQPRVAAVVLRREQARLVAARGNRRGRGRRRRRRRRRRHGDGRRRCCGGRRRCGRRRRLGRRVRGGGGGGRRQRRGARGGEERLAARAATRTPSP